jgi:hypothetical protein
LGGAHAGLDFGRELAGVTAEAHAAASAATFLLGCCDGGADNAYAEGDRYRQRGGANQPIGKSSAGKGVEVGSSVRHGEVPTAREISWETKPVL